MSLLEFHDRDYKDRWSIVKNVVHGILGDTGVPKEDWQDAFTNIFQITMWNDDNGKAELRNFLIEQVVQHLTELKVLVLPGSDESVLLKVYLKYWTNFARSSDYLGLLFKELDSHRDGGNQTATTSKPVKKSMFDIWSAEIYQPIRQTLLDSAIRLIHLERNGLVIDGDLVIGVRHSCTKLSQSSVELEIAYREGIENYYPPRIAEYIQLHGVRDYMTYAQKLINEEEVHAERYLEPACLPDIKKTCVHIFVVQYMDQLLCEMQTLLREENTDGIRLCYELVRQSPDGAKPILPLCEEYMEKVGLDLIRGNAKTMVKNAVKYVCGLIELYTRFSHLMSEAFCNDPLLLASRDKAYQEVVNNTEVFTTEIPSSQHSNTRRIESRCPELLASYCDLLLRRPPSNRRQTTEDIESRLKDVLLVLKYVNSKDIFMRFYKSHLIRRLLLQKSADSEMEELTVVRLRDIGMPAEQVNKLSRMFQDIKLSDDMTAKFKEFCRQTAPSTADASQPEALDTVSALPPSTCNADIFNFVVLSSGSWLLRSEPKANLGLPPELENVLPHIEEFYLKKHRGRHLMWQHYLSNGVMLYTSDRGRFELELTTHQIVLLYAWNRRYDAQFQLDSLSTITGLQEAEVRRTLWSLCAHPKMEEQLIIYEPKVASAADFTEVTQFWLNLNFCGGKGEKTPKRRFNLIGRLQLTQDASNEEEGTAVAELRQLRAQEGIIKVMKTRKQMHHNELYQELVGLIGSQFKLSRPLYKEVLEWLIDKQYISRLNTDMNVYTYLT